MDTQSKIFSHVNFHNPILMMQTPKLNGGFTQNITDKFYLDSERSIAVAGGAKTGRT